MTDKKLNLFCRIYRILLSISIVAAGLCLIYGCLSIYYSGDKPYSPQAVADAFSVICVPVYICLALSAISLVLGVIFPAPGLEQKVKISAKNQLELLLSKKDLSALENDALKNREHEKKVRLIITVSEAIVIALSAVVFLIYALNSNHYTTDINASVIKAMQVLLPCLGVMLAASAVAEILRGKSFSREIELIKKLPSVKGSENTANTTGKGDKRTLIIRCVILLLGIGLLVYGFATGGVYDVMTKAINICTECIGLG